MMTPSKIALPVAATILTTLLLAHMTLRSALEVTDTAARIGGMW